MQLDQQFWNNRYLENQTGWDIGYPSTPLKEYIDQLENKDLRILIPGCGNAYEAEYLHQQGFTNVTLVDLAPLAIEKFKEKVPDFPHDKLIVGDFFDLSSEFDLILEQTFFCALSPDLRSQYAEKMSSLLTTKGKLVGVMFNFPEMGEKPPFGGSKEEYEGYFKPQFSSVRIDDCRNSIAPRQGSEYWVTLKR